SQVSDGFTGAGATNGAAINNTLHLLMTDAGATGTTNGSNIVEYTIANVDPFTGGVIPHTVVNTFDGSHSAASSNIQAVALDKKGDMFVGNAGSIVELDPGGNFLGQFTVPSSGTCAATTLASLDVSADGNFV